MEPELPAPGDFRPEQGADGTEVDKIINGHSFVDPPTVGFSVRTSPTIQDICTGTLINRFAMTTSAHCLQLLGGVSGPTEVVVWIQPQGYRNSAYLMLARVHSLECRMRTWRFIRPMTARRASTRQWSSSPVTGARRQILRRGGPDLRPTG